MAARGEQVLRVLGLVVEHPQFSSSVLCDSNGNKNALGNLLAKAKFRDDQLRRMKPLDVMLNLANSYQLGIPQAALVVHVNNTYHSSQKLMDKGERPIVDEDHAIQFAFEDPTFYLGENAVEIFEFAELLRSYQHPAIEKIAALLGNGARARYEKLHANLEEKLIDAYGSEIIGKQYFQSSDAVLTLCLNRRFFNARSVHPDRSAAKNFALLAKIAVHETQLLARQEIVPVIRSFFPAP